MTIWTAEEVTREILAVLPLLNRIMSAELRMEAGEDTTMPQFRVLAYLHESPQTLSGLAKKRRVSLQSAGELVQVLVERGWIARTPDPSDRRQSLLALTPLGLQHYEKSQQRMMQRLVPLIENLNQQEMAAVQLGIPALHRVLAEVSESEESDGRT